MTNNHMYIQPDKDYVLVDTNGMRVEGADIVWDGKTLAQHLAISDFTLPTERFVEVQHRTQSHGEWQND